MVHETLWWVNNPEELIFTSKYLINTIKIFINHLSISKCPKTLRNKNQPNKKNLNKTLSTFSKHVYKKKKIHHQIFIVEWNSLTLKLTIFIVGLW
jgi:guanylate kinase